MNSTQTNGLKATKLSFHAYVPGTLSRGAGSNPKRLMSGPAQLSLADTVTYWFSGKEIAR